MKIYVYPRGANPRVDKHIQRKPIEYCEEAVEVYGTAKWVDPADHQKGIICCDFLYFGEKICPPTPEQIAKLKKRLRSLLPSSEPDGCRFIAPKTEHNQTLPRLQVEHISVASNRWDWSHENQVIA